MAVFFLVKVIFARKPSTGDISSPKVMKGYSLLPIILFGSSRPYAFCKIGALKNFAKFTGKHMCQSLFFNKVVGLRTRDSGTVVFLKIDEFSKNTFLHRTPLVAASDYYLTFNIISFYISCRGMGLMRAWCARVKSKNRIKIFCTKKFFHFSLLKVWNYSSFYSYKKWCF